MKHFINRIWLITACFVAIVVIGTAFFVQGILTHNNNTTIISAIFAGIGLVLGFLQVVYAAIKPQWPTWKQLCAPLGIVSIALLLAFVIVSPVFSSKIRTSSKRATSTVIVFSTLTLSLTPTPTPSPTPTHTPTPSPTPTHTPTPTPTPQPIMKLSPTGVTFATPPPTNVNCNVVLPLGQFINITNTGGGILRWETGTPSDTWLIVLQGSRTGSVTAGKSGSIGLTVDPTNLGTGIYTASVDIISLSDGTSQTVEVTLEYNRCN